MKEYFRNDEATSAALKRGYLYTGDIGRVDAEGYITICGRKKSTIVTAGGKNVYPDELEWMLNKSAYILESIVLPVEDRKGNVRPAAVIVPDYDTLGTIEQLKGNLTEENVREFISGEIKALLANVPDYKRLMDFQIRDQELPKTSTRKVRRHLVTWIRE
jgi:long-chain acyl-CoA synthetase